MIKVYRDIDMNQRVYRYQPKPKAKKYRTYFLDSDGKRLYLSTFEPGNNKTDCCYSFNYHPDTELIFYKNRIENIKRRLGNHYPLVFEEV